MQYDTVQEGTTETMVDNAKTYLTELLDELELTDVNVEVTMLGKTGP